MTHHPPTHEHGISFGTSGSPSGTNAQSIHCHHSLLLVHRLIPLAPFATLDASYFLITKYYYRDHILVQCHNDERGLSEEEEAAEGSDSRWHPDVVVSLTQPFTIFQLSLYVAPNIMQQGPI